MVHLVNALNILFSLSQSVLRLAGAYALYAAAKYFVLLG